jgi:hypothetical protein
MEKELEWIKILPTTDGGKVEHFRYNLDNQGYKPKKEDSNPCAYRSFRYKCEIVPKKISLEQGSSNCKYLSSSKEGFICCSRINFSSNSERYLKFEFDSPVSAPIIEMSPEK